VTGHGRRPLGRPWVHYRTTTSTNDRARELARAGAPHGTLVSAAEQTAGRGRQGRAWIAPADRALLISLVLREAEPLLTLAAGVAVASVVGARAQIKWPNDVLLADGRKVAGILAESRPQEDWTVLGIGLNVAVRDQDLPVGLRRQAGSLGRPADDIQPILGELLGELERWLAAPATSVLGAWEPRDALRGAAVCWSDGHGIARGVDGGGRLVVALDDGSEVALEAGEVHLEPGPGGPRV
jgi:BirA family transcriptional regulator, biotin operon repressor / biotin---[acetyl-CoA-carboxylase] ligase